MKHKYPKSKHIDDMLELGLGIPRVLSSDDFDGDDFAYLPHDDDTGADFEDLTFEIGDSSHLDSDALRESASLESQPQYRLSKDCFESLSHRLKSTHLPTLNLYSVLMTQSSADQLVQIENLSLKSKLIHWVKEGADLNVAPIHGKNSGKTPLLISILNNNLSSSIALLEMGVAEIGASETFVGLDVNYQEPVLANTAFHYAVGKGFEFEERAGILNHGYPMSIACVCDSLMQNKANINAQNASGDTPLHIAYMRRDIAAIEWLKEQGADMNIQNHAGLSPIDLLETTYDEVKSYLNIFIKFYMLNQKRWDEGNAALGYERKSSGKSSTGMLRPQPVQRKKPIRVCRR